MAKTSYTDADINSLKRANPFLNNTEAIKYVKYKSVDPFPDIEAALLNSADLLKYLLTVGIIDPFDKEKLKGVTYQCTFSGEAHRFDSETKGMKPIHLGDNEELVLEKNSITYLKIEEKIHVPDYMVLRFNLSVSNAYKGLLLGTGPIIDPGFDGNLFIPLHNLTGNEYVIKKGAPLIRIEFTKLSHSPVWRKERAKGLPSMEPITKETPPYALFSKSIEDALLDPDNKLFYAKEGIISVRSSIPDAIANSAKQAEDAQKSAAQAERSAKSIEKKLKRWSIIGVISVVIAVIGVVISVVGILLNSYSLIQDANARYDGMFQEINNCKQQICDLAKQLGIPPEQLDLCETDQLRGTEQSTTTAIFGETVSPSSSSLGEADGDGGS